MLASSRDSSTDGGLRNAVEALEVAAKTPAKQRSQNTATVLNTICNHASHSGLDRTSLEAIVDIVTVKSKLDQTSITNLIRNLYPAQRVPPQIIVIAVGALGQGGLKPSLATQNALLRWIICVYDLQEDRSVLSRLYGVLFGLLDMISLRTYLCYLLCLITRRNHVKPFRIQQLFEFARTSGDDVALRGLLHAYKDHYPDIIMGAAIQGRAKSLTHPDLEWTKHAHSLLQLNASGHYDTSQAGFRVFRDRARTGVPTIPELHTIRAGEASVTLEDIDNPHDFVNMLERIQAPSQLISCLTDPLLQKFMLLRPSSDASRRLDLFLSGLLEFELSVMSDGFKPSKRLPHLLEGLLCHARYKKTINTNVQRFLQVFIPLWDGVSYAESLLELLSYTPIGPFERLRNVYLDPLKAVLNRQSSSQQNKLLTFLSQLTDRWALLVMTGSTITRSQAAESSQAFLGLIDYSSTLMLSMLCSDPDNVVTSSLALAYFEQLAKHQMALGRSETSPLPIRIPSAHIVYLLLLGLRLSDLSRICGILAVYKKGLEMRRNSSQVSKNDLNTFNGFLMDACNPVWRSRAFSKTDSNAVGCLCSEPVINSLQSYITNVDREYAFPSLFNLSHNHLICAISMVVIRAMENEAERAEETLLVQQAGPVTHHGLAVLDREGGVRVSWKQYRLEVLRWLDERGAGGIKQMIYATMKDLMDGSR